MAMYFSRVLCSRGIGLNNQVNSIRALNKVQGVRCISIKVVPKTPEPDETYDERNMRLHRELAPHLSIYKMQLTMTLSITHRITGLMLTGYITTIGFGALILPHDFSHYITMIEGLQLSSASLIAIKLLLAFPASYHLCNGIRHLVWDNAKLLKMKEVYSSGYAMLGSSVALTILLALLALCSRGFGLYNQANALRSLNKVQGVRCISMKVVQKPAELGETYDEKNMRLNRELAPHLTIYKYQLTSVLSITHRMTGLMLTGYITVLGFGALVLPHDFSHYITMIEGLHMSSASLIIMKMILAFPASFHLCNGVRHLLWDTGKFLKLKEVYSTGYAMLGTSAALTILLALL